MNALELKRGAWQAGLQALYAIENCTDIRHRASIRGMIESVEWLLMRFTDRDARERLTVRFGDQLYAHCRCLRVRDRR